jgi:putative endonuclease
MTKLFYVYILRSFSGVLYIGVTSNLAKRLYEHQEKAVEGFTKRYYVDKLICYEVYENPDDAIKREKQLKNWNRKKKIGLIIKSNPNFSEIKLSNLI